MCEEIKRAVEENEPRVEVETVSVKRGEDGEGNALHVRLVYSVVGDDTEGATITEETTVFGK